MRKPRIPIQRWVFVAVLFYSINMLNNWAFAYKISVPVHIILRSFGSVTTMIAGALRGKRYSHLQVMSVVMLTVGVLISAWADSEGKVSSPCKATGEQNLRFDRPSTGALCASHCTANAGHA